MDESGSGVDPMIYWLLILVWPVFCAVVLIACATQPRLRDRSPLLGLLVSSAVLFAVGVATLMWGNLGIGLFLGANALVGGMVTAFLNMVLALVGAAVEWRSDRESLKASNRHR